jgi:hypothetical protein
MPSRGQKEKKLDPRVISGAFKSVAKGEVAMYAIVARHQVVGFSTGL